MNRLFSLFLAVSMLLSLSCNGKQELQPTQPEVKPDDHEPVVDKLFGGGEGTAEKPFLISSAKDLDTLAWLVNHQEERFVKGVYSQTADISGVVLKTSIGGFRDNHPFSGRYHGNGHTVSGLQIESASEEGAGLFAYLLDASVDRLSINGCAMAGSGSYRGALAGVSSQSEISACSVSGTVNLGEVSYAGGLVGAARMSTVRDCSFKGQLQGKDHVGGIVGMLEDVTLSGCSSEGTIQGQKNVGGIVGVALAPSDRMMLVNQCANTANVTANFNLGGIVGFLQSADCQLRLQNCANSGNTLHAIGSDTNGYTRIGGILGGTVSSSSGKLDIWNCCSFNVKMVLDYANDKENRVRGIGGIVGSFYCPGSISTCWSNLLHTDVETVGTPYYKGAIVGYSSNKIAYSADNYFDVANIWGAYFSTTACVGIETKDFTNNTLLNLLNQAVTRYPASCSWMASSTTYFPLPNGTPTPDVPAPTQSLRVLAIGNSFTEDATDQYLSDLFITAGYSIIIGNCYIGGCTLERHWNNESSTDENTRNSNTYYKYVQGVKTTTSKVSIATILQDEPWDYVILGQGAGLYGIVDSHYPYLDNFIDYFKSYLTAGSYRVGYQLNWAFPANCTDSRFDLYDKDQLKMYFACRDCAFTLKDRSGLDLIIPTGTAIQSGRTSSLGDTFNRDWGHLDKNHGRFTAACTWFETITGLNVEYNSYAPSNLTNEVIGICRKAAHNAVQHPKEIIAF